MRSIPRKPHRKRKFTKEVDSAIKVYKSHKIDNTIMRAIDLSAMAYEEPEMI